MSFFRTCFRTLTGPPGVSHNSFAAQPPDLLLRFYVYPLGFGLVSNLTHRLALYPVSVRRLFGFATPLPPPTPLLASACGSLHLAVNTRGRTFTCKNCAMPGTLKKIAAGFESSAAIFLKGYIHRQQKLQNRFSRQMRMHQRVGSMAPILKPQPWERC